MTKYNDLGNDTLNIYLFYCRQCTLAVLFASSPAAYLIFARPPHLFPSTWHLNKEVWSLLFPRDQAGPDDEFLSQLRYYPSFFDRHQDLDSDFIKGTIMIIPSCVYLTTLTN